MESLLDEEVQSPLVTDEVKESERSASPLIHAVKVDLDAESKEADEEQFIEVKATYADEASSSPLLYKHSGVIAVPIEPLEVERLVPVRHEPEPGLRRIWVAASRPSLSSRDDLALRFARCSANAAFVFVSFMIVVTIMRVLLLQFLREEAEAVCGSTLAQIKLDSDIETGRELSAWVTVPHRWTQSLDGYDPGSLPEELAPYQEEAFTRLLSAARVVQTYEERTHVVDPVAPRFLYSLALFGDELSEEAAACLAYYEDSWEELVSAEMTHEEKYLISEAVWIDFIPGTDGPLDWSRAIEDISRFLRSRYGNELATSDRTVPQTASVVSGLWLETQPLNSIRLADEQEAACIGNDAPTLEVSQSNWGDYFSIPVLQISGEAEICSTLQSPTSTMPDSLVLPPMGDFTFCKTIGNLVFGGSGHWDTSCRWYSHGQLEIRGSRSCITVHESNGIVRISNGCVNDEEDGSQRSGRQGRWKQREIGL